MEHQIWKLINSSIYKLQGIRDEMKRSRHFNEQCEVAVRESMQDMQNIMNLQEYEKKKKELVQLQ